MAKEKPTVPGIPTSTVPSIVKETIEVVPVKK